MPSDRRDWIFAMLSGLLGPNEAQAAALPGFRKAFVEAFHAGKGGTIKAGTFAPEAFERLKEIYPDAVNNVRVSLHPADSRMIRDGWSAERTADAIVDLLDSKSTDFVKNLSRKKGNSDYGALLPYDIDPLFAPFLKNRGAIDFKTVYSPLERKLKKAGYGVEGGKPLISRILPHPGFEGGDMAPKASTQPLPIIPVVTPQPGFENRIRGLEKLVNKSGPKSAAPIAAGSASLAPTDAHGLGTPPQEPGLESPWFDPVDILAAPAGVPGAAGKAAAMGISGSIGALLEALLGRHDRATETQEENHAVFR